jgi:hypothetical protein
MMILGVKHDTNYYQKGYLKNTGKRAEREGGGGFYCYRCMVSGCREA